MEKLEYETNDREDKSHKISIHKVQCSTRWGSRRRIEEIELSVFLKNEENIERYNHHTERANKYHHRLAIVYSIDSRNTSKVEGMRNKTYYYLRPGKRNNRKSKINK